MHFGGHRSLSVELVKVKIYLNKQSKTRKIFEGDNKTRDLGKLKKVSHGRSWNLESLKEYEP